MKDSFDPLAGRQYTVSVALGVFHLFTAQEIIWLGRRSTALHSKV